MSTQLDNTPYDDSLFQQSLPQIYRATLAQFRRISVSFVLFKALFYACLALELLVFFLMLPLSSTLIAISLCALFLTIFSYVVLLFYFQAKKPEQLVSLKEQLLSSFRKICGSEHEHLPIASALTKLSSYLDLSEQDFYRIPEWLKPFGKLLHALAALCHGQDVFRFKQLLLHAAIDEYISQVRLTPTDLEVHASLGNAYVLLSHLYLSTPASAKTRSSLEANFQIAGKLALEQFHILNHYAPNDPWVHEQLIQGYRSLKKHEEEIKQIELLLQLRPQDADLYLRLGVLYFERGLNAKGLTIYEKLKLINFKKAEELIGSYCKVQSLLS